MLTGAGTLPKTDVFYEKIYYKNITSTGGGDKHGTVVSFTCGTQLHVPHQSESDLERSDLKGPGSSSKHNCAGLSFESVVFKGLGSASKKTGMVCSGAKGSAKGLVGINNCL